MAERGPVIQALIAAINGPLYHTIKLANCEYPSETIIQSEKVEYFWFQCNITEQVKWLGIRYNAFRSSYDQLPTSYY
jgi:hypothetical protein